MRYNIWEYSVGANHSATDDFVFGHPAVFPEALAEDHIRSWSNRGDLVLDCMMGSGTTGYACLKLERNFIGIEKVEKYFKIAEKRLKKYSAQTKRTNIVEAKKNDTHTLVQPNRTHNPIQMSKRNLLAWTSIPQ